MIRVCGLDEVGRGAFAGPLVAAAVIVRGRLTGLFENSPVPIRDSKTLSHSQRLRVTHYLIKKGVRVVIEEIPVTLINQRGMAWANREIFVRLFSKMKATKYIVDGNIKFSSEIKKKIESRVRADRITPQVVLASIFAKLHRDKIMRRLHKTYPQYYWQLNKGYGTQQHRDAITKYGPCEYHRALWLATWQKKLPT